MLRVFLTILTMLTILVPVASAAQAPSSSACFALPTDTVNQWIGLFPDGNTDQQCGNNCSTWVKTCNNMASASYRCFSALFNSVMMLDIAECGLLSEPDKGNCIRNVQSSFRSLLNNLISDLESARSICGSQFNNCFNACTD